MTLSVPNIDPLKDLKIAVLTRFNRDKLSLFNQLYSANDGPNYILSNASISKLLIVLNHITNFLLKTNSPFLFFGVINMIIMLKNQNLPVSFPGIPLLIKYYVDGNTKDKLKGRGKRKALKRKDWSCNDSPVI
uniref:Uncharacterized protein n=1 Tax=Tetranychus urticae TaxID=32264 RepID=T1JXJ9_TETUR